jgi:hypothetical protein
MSERTHPLLLAAALAVAASVPLAAAEPVENGGPTRIGRYELVRASDALEIQSPGDARVSRFVLVGGAALVVLGLLWLSRGRRGSAIALVLVGLGVGGIGLLARADGTRWRASPVELARERSGGRVDRWRRDEIAWVEVRRRAPDAEGLKRTPPRPFEVRLHKSDGSRLPTRFSFAAESEARALARELGAALGVGVRE